MVPVVQYLQFLGLEYNNGVHCGTEKAGLLIRINLVSHLQPIKQCFGSGSFCPDPERAFFLSPDQNYQKTAKNCKCKYNYKII